MITRHRGYNDFKYQIFFNPIDCALYTEFIDGVESTQFEVFLPDQNKTKFCLQLSLAQDSL